MNFSDVKILCKLKDIKIVYVIEDLVLEWRFMVILRYGCFEEGVDGLEKEMDDCEFLIEFRDLVFDFIFFLWNKLEYRINIIFGIFVVMLYSSYSLFEDFSYVSSLWNCWSMKNFVLFMYMYVFIKLLLKDDYWYSLKIFLCLEKWYL